MHKLFFADIFVDIVKLHFNRELTVFLDVAKN